MSQKVEPYFDQDSYGYRPNKSALDAVGITRERCWWKNWVIEFDIKGLFDNIDHPLLMKAVRKHTDNRWVILYIERWIKSEILMPDGSIKSRTKGVPQGGVISPILANLFLHYAFDYWMRKYHPTILWCRYADDGLLHFRRKREAENLLVELNKRFNECGLELHRDKTKLIYCNYSRYKINYPHREFDFLGYTFRDRWTMNLETKRKFLGYC